MKKIFYIVSFMLLPSVCFAWSGFIGGEFVMPQRLAEFCELDKEKIKQPENIYNCFDKLEEERKEDKNYIMRLSSQSLQDYYKYGVATSAQTKDYAAKFMSSMEKVQAEGIKGYTQEDYETSDLKENIDEVVVLATDNAKLLNKFLQQYTLVLLTDSYEVFNDHRIMFPPVSEKIGEETEVQEDKTGS